MKNLYFIFRLPIIDSRRTLKTRLLKEKERREQEVTVKELSTTATSSVAVERSSTRPVATAFNEEQLTQLK